MRPVEGNPSTPALSKDIGGALEVRRGTNSAALTFMPSGDSCFAADPEPAPPPDRGQPPEAPCCEAPCWDTAPAPGRPGAQRPPPAPARTAPRRPRPAAVLQAGPGRRSPRTRPQRQR
ncbi:unnamed protein product [Prorocentrum cordatum]|uniref:Uncharacterized protein n=1 Tax=Prorocentrum cordatum TaxID=2364126 RepID=A0ABN9UL41_9DINO|nr:unnamed protein product [Polarella glacialis]